MSDPTILDSIVFDERDSFDIGTFSNMIVSAENTTYSVRAFVEDSEGNVYYGNVVEVTTTLLLELDLTPQIPIIDTYETIQFNVLGLYSDGTIVDVTALVSWEEQDYLIFVPIETDNDTYESELSDGYEVASVNSAGLATALSGGIANIRAALGIITARTLLCVQPLLNEDSPMDCGVVPIVGGWDKSGDPFYVSPNLLEMYLIMSTPMLVGQSQQAGILGLYDNDTEEIIPSINGTWESSNTSVATVDITGLIVAVEAGVTFIKVTYEIEDSPSQTFTSQRMLTVNQEGITESTSTIIQQIPLKPLPNQSFRTTVATSEDRHLDIDFKLCWNESAGYWTMTLIDPATGDYYVDAIPLLSGDSPTFDLLRQYKHLDIGSCFIVNISNLESNVPTKENLGIDYIMVWGYTNI
jgi:hypothetical protein